MSVFIHNVLISDGDSTASASVELKGDRIYQVYSPIDATVDTFIDGRDKLLLPGFVNAHTHSSQVWQCGLILQRPLEVWLADVDVAALYQELRDRTRHTDLPQFRTLNSIEAHYRQMLL
ncbi:hypothetical protein [Gloeocapsopsis sp. IPPAS B-1203]|uniref:hypothetical protein n=1 Tax=Gloeocapsopsis sp. IPPAS B-1203 TaxID=2049454 RepID=UPI000C1A7ADC|nr:hypothetical protein [Gloeocapsopsis sp. IPPAS B-1203]PIG92499.1 hypothetical protein CSQ79_15530 [Gloeocapsopsis sp. IPPAS B-1203]